MLAYGDMHSRALHSILLTALASAACGGETQTASSSGASSSSSSSSSSGGSSGGSSGITPPAPPSRPYDCGQAVETLDRLRASTGADYIEMRQGALPPETTYKVEVASGQKCATATDKEKCQQDLDALTSDQFLVPPCGGCVPAGKYLVYTKGDTVAKVTSAAELRSWLGATDDPAKAYMLVTTGIRYSVDCSSPWVSDASDGYYVLATETLSDCPITTQPVLLHVARDGTVTVVQRGEKKESNACVGRRPEGLVAAKGADGSALARHFAEAARLEAASVEAFRILERELAAHGAPRSLLRACDRARADEVRHARAMAKLARRYGARVEKPRVERRGIRDLFAIAAENAVEGCVNETYGALEGLHQARAAKDPEIRKVMAEIARDEIRHAALSWRVAAWIEPRLSADERARLRDLRARAVLSLAQRNAQAPDASIVAQAGVPDAHAATALAASLREQLWAA